MSDDKKPTSLSDTSVDRLADEVTQRLRVAAKRRTPVQRATQAVARVADAPRKAPAVFWLIGLAFMAGGFWRMEQHKHAPEGGYVHLGSDWLVMLVGIAFLPGAAHQVGHGLGVLGKGLASIAKLVRKNGGTS